MRQKFKKEEILQILSGILVFISFFQAWIYDGGLNYFYGSELKSMLINPPFLLNLIYLLLILGIANVYYGWNRKYNSTLSWTTAIVVFLLLWSIVSFNSKSENLVAGNGFYMAAVGMIAAVASILIVRKERAKVGSETKDVNN
jgi:heme A synthase